MIAQLSQLIIAKAPSLGAGFNLRRRDAPGRRVESSVSCCGLTSVKQCRALELPGEAAPAPEALSWPINLAAANEAAPLKWRREARNGAADRAARFQVRACALGRRAADRRRAQPKQGGHLVAPAPASFASRRVTVARRVAHVSGAKLKIWPNVARAQFDSAKQNSPSSLAPALVSFRSSGLVSAGAF